MGGQAEEIRRFLKDHYKDGMTLDEALQLGARYLFEKVIPGARNANVFLENGARLYLDTGFHPEYATPECDDVTELVIHDKAGERIVEDLLHQAEKRLREDGISGNILLFKNNTDSAGNSYGCHENYLVSRDVSFQRLAEALIPFFVTRQIVAGAGKVLQAPRGFHYCLSQRAQHICPETSGATTSSRPILNTRDQPHSRDEGRPGALDRRARDARDAPHATQPRARLGHQAPAHRELHEPPPAHVARPQGLAPRPSVPRHPARQGRLLPPGCQRPRGPDHR